MFRQPSQNPATALARQPSRNQAIVVALHVVGVPAAVAIVVRSTS
jgi:hypothetical protein